MKKSILTVFSVLLIMSIVVAGCASGTQSNSVSIYTAFPEQEVIVYIEEFEKETGIEVKFVRLSAGETLARIKANDGLLEGYHPEGVQDIPEQYRDANGIWTPVYVGALGFASNTEWLEREGIEPPQSWEDLLKPEYKGNVTMAHPASSGTAYSIYATLVQLKGELEQDNRIRKFFFPPLLTLPMIRP